MYSPVKINTFMTVPSRGQGRLAQPEYQFNSSKAVWSATNTDTVR